MDNSQLSDELKVCGLLKPEQVAIRLNIAKSYVYRLMQTGEIPVVRIGKACRVRPQDLEEYIERNLHNPVGAI